MGFFNKFHGSNIEVELVMTDIDGLATDVVADAVSFVYTIRLLRRI